jgi:heme-degrading monooxygenase HmoA
MTKPRGAIAVMFVNQRNARDGDGYGETADAMDRAAARQPGYLGMDSVRGADGLGITISYWADEAAARGWRADLAHRDAIERGRSDWYDRYEVIVAEVTRSYDWARES